jgi:cation diffusion facilitator CzcD-associated flavoprotein CzcO
MDGASAAGAPDAARVRILIIGGGYAGLGAAIRLRQEGITDFVVLERSGALGGVWRDNVYPGCACDVQSHLYQYSFAPNPDWTERYSSGPEIQAYLERCATEFGVRPHLRFGHDVLGLDWDAAAGLWVVTTSRGPFAAGVVVVAVGALSEPLVPRLPGLERFEGPAFHSARWDRDFDPAGRRLAVVGTGASAVQIVPAVQPVARQVILFQRTPAWVLPRWNRRLGPRTRALFRRVPALQRLTRALLHAQRELLGVPFRHAAVMRALEGLGRLHLRRSVPDPALRTALTPDYMIGCKRIMVSDDYLPALTRPNVTLVRSPVSAVRPRAVVAADGSEHAVDAIVLCTGFRATEFPFAGSVRGRGGRSLAEAWEGSPKAHVGTTVHGFPNLFILQGPNTGLGHSSVVMMQEAQVEHLLNALRHLDRHGAAVVEPTAEAQAAFVARVDRRMAGTVWMYLDATGRNSTLWPGSIGQFRRRVSPFRPAEYHVDPTPVAAHD